MTQYEIVIDFTCPKCGPTKLQLPENPTDDDNAKCATCGEDFGPYGEIKSRSKQAVKADVRKILKKTVKGIKRR